MNIKHNIIEVIEERQLKQFRYLKRFRSNRTPEMILEWNTKGKRKKENEGNGLRRILEEDTKDTVDQTQYY